MKLRDTDTQSGRDRQRVKETDRPEIHRERQKETQREENEEIDGQIAR